MYLLNNCYPSSSRPAFRKHLVVLLQVASGSAAVPATAHRRFHVEKKQRRGLLVTLPETIVRRRCAALIPYARNARTHSDQQVAQIADDAPEPPAHPVAEPGDLWVLGRHRLLCGDSTVATDVERVLGGVAPHLMVTDPPYGVNYDPAWRNQAGRNNFAIGRGHYHCKHEPCWYVVRKGSTASWVGDHSQTTLWQIDKNLKSETGHGTQKPVECMRRPIENTTSPGQAVYEPFSGSD